MSRPALITDVMHALHQRSTSRLAQPVELPELEHTLGEAEFGVLAAALGAAEHGWLEVFEGSATFGSITRVCLTQLGRHWSPGQEPDPIRYAYVVDEVLTVGTLADWAKAWEHDQYAGDIQLSFELCTWARRSRGYSVHIAHLPREDNGADWLDYRVWAAGEQVTVRIDGRA